jgi:hypothetical protein
MWLSESAPSGVVIPKTVTDPLLLTALASQLTSRSSHVWAIRRKR